MKQIIRNYAFLQGLYLGCFLIFITTIFYMYDENTILPTFNIYSFVFMLILFSYPIIVLKTIKIPIEHSIFKNYFSICFLIMFFARFLTALYFYILYNFLDSELIIKYVSFQYDSCLIDPDCDQSFEDLLDWFQNNYFTISGQLHSYLFSLIPCTLYSAIISLCMKYARPL